MTNAKIEKTFEYILPNVQDFVFILIFIAVLGMGSRMLNIDGDLGRHLTIGQYILDQHTIPVTDIFSFTKTGEPLTPHEWMAQVSFAVAYRLAGLNGVVWLCAVVLGLTFSILYRLCFKTSQSSLSALFVVILAAAASSLHWLTRPHLFTMLFFVIWFYLLENIRANNSNKWWGLPLVMLFWVNFHGAFIAGFVAWLAYIAGDIWEQYFAHASSDDVKQPHIKSLLLGGASALIVTILNPVGWKIWQTSLGFIRNSYLVGHTAEYLPPNFHEASTWPFLLMIFLSLWAFALTRPKLPAALAFMIAGWTILALYSIRNIPLYAIAAAPGLALTSLQLKQFNHTSRYFELDRQITEVSSRLKGWVSPLIVILVFGAGLSVGLSFNISHQKTEFSTKVFPVEAANWLEDHPQSGNGFNYFTWGGYLLYRFWPEMRVFIDGQTDFYGEQLTREYESVITEQPGWQYILNNYKIEWLILPTDLDLGRHLLNSDTWNVIYQDDTSLILRKKQP